VIRHIRSSLEKEREMNKADDVQTFEYTETYLDSRADWIVWRYELDSKRVREILRRTAVEELIDVGIWDSLEVTPDLLWSLLPLFVRFDPSIEEALRFLRPAVAIEMFENCDLNEVSKLIALAKQVAPRLFESLSPLQSLFGESVGL